MQGTVLLSPSSAARGTQCCCISRQSRGASNDDIRKDIVRSKRRRRRFTVVVSSFSRSDAGRITVSGNMELKLKILSLKQDPILVVPHGYPKIHPVRVISMAVMMVQRGPKLRHSLD